MTNRVWIAPVALFAANLALADFTEEQHFSFELNAGGRISIENINGGIDITGGTGNAVEITVVKRAGSQKYLDGIEVIVDARDDLIRIETKHPENKGWFNWGGDSSGSVHYTLSVPANANLDTIESVNGDIEIRGVYGLVKAETVNGSIEARDLSANAGLETVNGSVEAVFTSLTGAQKVECESVNGRVTLVLPDNADASISAETVNGGIDGDDFGLKTNKGFVGRDLDGEVGDGSARVSLSTVNGGIKIRKR